MYKKRSSICLMMSIVFNGYAMKADYELVAVSDNESALVTALQKIDEAYETREQAKLLCWWTGSSETADEMKKTIRARKQAYYDLVPEQRTDLVFDEKNSQNWQGISNLNISDKGLKTALFVLPNYINPANIKYLNLAKNNLEELPLSLLAKTMLNLETLDVSGNNITYVSTHGSRMPRLTHLTLSHNRISGIDLIRLLKKCPLTMLDLSHNPLETVMTDKSESTWNAYVNKEFAIDVRNTKVSLEDVELLKKYCLAGVHNSFKAASVGPFAGMIFVFSYFGFVGISFFAHEFSWATLAGGVLSGTTVASAAACAVYRRDTADHKEFHAIRYDDKGVEEEDAKDIV